MSKPTRDECIAYLQEAVGAKVILEDVGAQAIALLRFDSENHPVVNRQICCPSCGWHFLPQESPV